MTTAIDTDREIVTTRIVNWPRSMIFAAFADAEQLAAWWGPKDFSNTFETFDFRPGGPWRFVMHGPDGKDYKNESVFAAISAPSEIIIDHISRPKFTLAVKLDDLPGQTRITWRMRFPTVEERERVALYAVPANEENLDRLEALLADRGKTAAAGRPPKRSVTHATFVIDRDYDASPARVFAAFADPKLKAMWFSGPPEWGMERAVMDFRVGGFETSEGGPQGGPKHRFVALYQDIVPNERIVYSYDMHLDAVRISVSLATIEIRPEGGGTRLRFTEQGAFLDGFDDAGGREHGTRELLNQLGASLAAPLPH